MKKRSIRMDIDEELYKLSKVIIPNRTKDYEDYLRRKIVIKDRLGLLQKDRDDLQSQMEYLDKEIDLEMEILEKRQHIEHEAENEIDKAIKIVLNIIHNEGVIGKDKLEEIATFRNINFTEFKANIPIELQDKITNYHPKITNDKRVTY